MYEKFSTRHCSPRCGNPFQVQGLYRETTLLLDRDCEGGQHCKTREIPISGKMGKNRNFGYKMVISVKNPKFILYISDDEMNFTVGIVSRNLASTSNFVEFRDSRS